MGQLGTGGAAKTEEFLKKFLRGGKAHFQSKTLPKALRTQVLTALTSSFGLIWWVGFGMFGSVGLLGEVLFGLVGLVW